MKRLCITCLSALVALLSASAMAAPFAYSVNSDQPDGDTLYSIDLANGSASPIGTGVVYLSDPPAEQLRRDIEGLALAPSGDLWAVDEDKMKLFRIDTSTGIVVNGSQLNITGTSERIGNDFGLTFTCDGSLYASSVTSQTLYRLDPATGAATVVGAPEALGVNISAIAAHGVDPLRLYGLSNGYIGEFGPVDTRSLYSIDPVTGATELIGALGPGVADYAQAGMSFDSEGNLWAITDRSQFGQVSQILSINTETGAGTVIAQTGFIGFESLAAAFPGGCDPVPVADEEPMLWDIPTLDSLGQLIITLVLLLTGWAALRQRPF